MKKISELNKKDLRKEAKKLKESLSFLSDYKKVTIKDIVLVLECAKKHDYTKVFNTKIYNNLGVVYCCLLEKINSNYIY